MGVKRDQEDSGSDQRTGQGRSGEPIKPPQDIMTYSRNWRKNFDREEMGHSITAGKLGINTTRAAIDWGSLGHTSSEKRRRRK